MAKDEQRAAREATYQQRTVDITEAKLNADAKRSVLEQDLARELQDFRRLHSDPDHQRLYREFFRVLEGRVRESGLSLEAALRALLVPPATASAPAEGLRVIPYGPGHEYATREDAEKAMQRGHLDGCVRDSDHSGPCGLEPLPAGVKLVKKDAQNESARGHVNGCAMLSCKNPPVAGTPLCCVHEGDVKNVTVSGKTPCLFAVYGKGVCHLPHGHREDHWFGAPVLSPRQALGEALACVERAEALLGAVTVHLPGQPSRETVGTAHDRLTNAKILLRSAYEAAK